VLLSDFLDPRTILMESRILTREQVYENMMRKLCETHKHDLPICGMPLLEKILERDREASTAYPSGIAIPHIRLDGFQDTLISLCFMQNPLDFDGTMVSWVALIITDKSSSRLYLNIVAELLGLSKNQALMERLLRERDGVGIKHVIAKEGIRVSKDIFLSDIMISDPVVVHPDTTLKELNALMNTHNIAGFPVVDEKGRFKGDVNILNLLKVGVPDYLLMLENLAFLQSYEPLEKIFEQEESILVKDLMDKDVITLNSNASIIEAVYEMILHKKRYFSVVDQGQLKGVITAMDIFRKVIKA